MRRVLPVIAVLAIVISSRKQVSRGLTTSMRKTMNLAVMVLVAYICAGCATKAEKEFKKD
jgi:F0F1-type ATP synthase membrane subunit a